MASPTQVTVQEKLVRFDNLLAGLELLAEEIRTRKDLVLTDEYLEELFVKVVDDEERIGEICRRITSRIGTTSIVNGVARQVKADIEKAIDAYLETKLAEPSIASRLDKLIANHAAGIAPAPVEEEPEQRPLEELTYESTEDIAARFVTLAGDTTWE
jgi:hypothetical protein